MNNFFAFNSFLIAFLSMPIILILPEKTGIVNIKSPVLTGDKTGDFYVNSIWRQND